MNILYESTPQHSLIQGELRGIVGAATDMGIVWKD
jgi:hypothetical protein